MRLLDIGGGFIGGVGSEKNLKMVNYTQCIKE